MPHRRSVPLSQMNPNLSWEFRAEVYRGLADTCENELTRWGYMQLAGCCDRQAAVAQHRAAHAAKLRS